MKPLRIALVGQLNSGKSTLFNNLAGFKTLSGNFPGTTVGYTISRTRFLGREVELIDLPGIYSLSYSDIAEKVTRDFLLKEDIDVIINVVDASVLSRSLELTLQLLELEKPLVLCLNMVDEARRKGIEIDEEKLSEILGVPVVSTVAVRGMGIVELMSAALNKARKGIIPKFHKDVEEVILKVQEILPAAILEKLSFPARFLAIRLLEGEEEYIEEIKKLPKGEEILKVVKEKAGEIEQGHGAPFSFVLSSERHALSLNIFEQVCKVVHPPKELIDDILDRYVMHPIAGYFFLIVVLGIVFLLVFNLGNLIGSYVLLPFDGLTKILQPLSQRSLLFSLLQGLIEGIAGGIGIVLPYLVPLLFFISLLEDVGYLPRVAFLLDGLFHRIGLHGKSVIPFVLGYGCNVPALIATRILDSPIDRLITSLLVSFIPCSARSVVILALVGAYLGAPFAFALYFFNLLVVALLGKLLRGLFPGSLEAFIMDIPTYKMPPLRYIGKKTWFRLYEFIVFAWPVIIFASLIMSFLSFYKIDSLINALLSPLTVGALGLPKVVGTTLFFGILRKELTLILLTNVLGTTNITAVLSHLQILVFTTFVLFYVPCVSFLAVMWREIGAKYTFYSFLLSLFIATLIASLLRLFGTFCF
jgi:ferrous iron transport protein B